MKNYDDILKHNFRKMKILNNVHKNGFVCDK